MKIFKEYRQDQNFLLPPSLGEFVPGDHEVRIVNDVVDALDASLFLGRYEGGGAPAYHPAMMLKVIIYAYSLGIYSSRRIAQELKTDTAFMFLSGLQAPRLPNHLPFPDSACCQSSRFVRGGSQTLCLPGHGGTRAYS